jgi:hypothetical protein
MLTPAHFTPENALKAGSTGPRSASGTCTPDAPWGGQCTRYLKDGTPVDSGFVNAVLRVLSGETQARQEYLRKWNARIAKICGQGPRDITVRNSTRDPRDIFITSESIGELL